MTTRDTYNIWQEEARTLLEAFERAARAGGSDLDHLRADVLERMNMQPHSDARYARWRDAQFVQLPPAPDADAGGDQ